METKNNRQTPDLYLMLSPGFDTLHLKRGAEWVEGFSAFAENNARKAMESPFIPDNWLFHYHFSDEQLQLLSGALAAPRNREYFREMLPALQQNQIHPLQILTLRDACQAIQAGVRVDMPKKEKLIDLFTSNRVEDELNLVLPPFQCWKAVSTCQGTLLFSNSPKGNRLLEHYLQYQADHFYNPQMPQTQLVIGLLPKFDRSLSRFVDRCPKLNTFDDDSGELLNLPPEIFAPDDVMHNANLQYRLHMDPCWQNCEELLLPANETGLHCSQRNYEIMFLQCAVDNG